MASGVSSSVHLQAKRGKHSSKEVSVPRINDVSAPGQGARAKQYLPFLQRGGKLLGLVESVSSGEQNHHRSCA
jgi:staphylococcal nuclease domain-containing protein 1